MWDSIASMSENSVGLHDKNASKWCKINTLQWACFSLSQNNSSNKLWHNQWYAHILTYFVSHWKSVPKHYQQKKHNLCEQCKVKISHRKQPHKFVFTGRLNFSNACRILFAEKITSTRIFQVQNKLQKLNQNKMSLFLSFFIVFNHLSVV